MNQRFKLGRKMKRKELETENKEELGLENKHSISISNFEGPLDLLCYLVTKNKMDIFEVSISEITDQYIKYLYTMQSLDMNVATEFLVMASTLLYLKSKKLIPITEIEFVEEGEITEEELLEKIANYKQYKDKQEILREMYTNNFGTFEKYPEKIKIKRSIDESILLKMSDLVVLYKNVLSRIKDKVNLMSKNIEQIAFYERITIKSKVRQIAEIFKNKASFVFNKVFSNKENNKLDIVTAFLGVLELSRLKNVSITQKEMFGEIYVNKISESPIDISLIKE